MERGENCALASAISPDARSLEDAMGGMFHLIREGYAISDTLTNRANQTLSPFLALFCHFQDGNSYRNVGYVELKHFCLKGFVFG